MRHFELINLDVYDMGSIDLSVTHYGEEEPKPQYHFTPEETFDVMKDIIISLSLSIAGGRTSDKCNKDISLFRAELKNTAEEVRKDLIEYLSSEEFQKSYEEEREAFAKDVRLGVCV